MKKKFIVYNFFPFIVLKIIYSWIWVSNSINSGRFLVWVPSPLTSMIEQSAYSIRRTLLFLLCPTVFFGKMSNCKDNEYLFSVRVKSGEGMKEWYFCVPGTVFADANLPWSSEVVLSWCSLWLENTELLTWFLFTHWWRASVVKIVSFDDAWRVAPAARTFKLPQFSIYRPFPWVVAWKWHSAGIPKSVSWWKKMKSYLFIKCWAHISLK